MEQALRFLVQLVRTGQPDIAQPRPVAGGSGIGEFLFERVFLDPVDLKGEEQEVAGDRGRPLTDRLMELAGPGIAQIGGVQQLGITLGPRDRLRDRLVGLDRATERPAARRCEPAPPALVERPGVAFRPVQIGCERRAVGGGVKVGEVPLGQAVEASPFRLVCHRRLRQSEGI